LIDKAQAEKKEKRKTFRPPPSIKGAGRGSDGAFGRWERA